MTGLLFAAILLSSLMIASHLSPPFVVDELAWSMAPVASISGALRRRRGRPRKFEGPSRAVTLTLPESVIAALSTVHPDLSRAIVSLTKRARGSNHQPPAALAVFGKQAVITIRPTKSLEKVTGINLVPLPDGRALISLHHPKTVAELELLIYDALENDSLDVEDRRVFEGIGTILRDARRSSGVSLLHRSIIVLESSDRRSKAHASRA
jgi:hypothetical protein